MLKKLLTISKVLKNNKKNYEYEINLNRPDPIFKHRQSDDIYGIKKLKKGKQIKLNQTKTKKRKTKDRA